MKIFILIISFIFINSNLLSQWEKIDLPKIDLPIYNHKFIDGQLFGLNYDGDFLRHLSDNNWANLSSYKFDENRNIVNFVNIGSTIYLFYSNNFPNENGKYLNLFKSNNYGETWEFITDFDYGTERISFFNDNIYLATRHNKIYLFNIYSNKIDSLEPKIHQDLRYDLIEKSNDTLVITSYINEGNTYTNNILFSVDNGESWVIKNTFLPSQLKPRDIFLKDKFLLLGSSTGIFKSTNFGDRWESIPSNLSKFASSNIVKIEENDDIIYVATKRGLYSTNDLGLTWNKVGEFSNNFEFYYFKIENGILYFDANDLNTNKRISGYSEDFGLTFVEIGVSSDDIVYDFNVLDNEVYMSCESGLYKSDDIEKNYQLLSNDFKENEGRFERAIKNKDHYHLIKVFNSSLSKIYSSSNNGVDWEFIDLEQFGITEFYRDIELFEDKIYLPTPKGVYITTNNFETMEKLETNNDLINQQLNSVTDVLKDKHILYLFGPSTLIKYSNNNYEDLLSENSIEMNEIKNFKIDEFVSFNNSLFIITKSGFYSSSDYGMNWIKKEINIEYSFVDYPILRNYKTNLFLSVGKQLYYSKDFGDSWNNITDNLVERQFLVQNGIYVYKDDLLFFGLRVGYKRKMEDLGIEFTSVEESNIDCTNFIETDYFDLLGNKLEDNNIYNKQIIVRYKCLETGEITHKLEIRER